MASDNGRGPGTGRENGERMSGMEKRAACGYVGIAPMVVWGTGMPWGPAPRKPVPKEECVV